MDPLEDNGPDRDALLQNLSDAGLCDEEIERFLCCYAQNKRAAQLKILTEYRGKLPGTVQAGQEKLYCLDYLIRQIKADEPRV